MTDADFIDRALFLAARGRGRTSPNPMVGAVVVSADGLVVGEGYHERAGAPHAEVRALDAAGPRAKGGTLYCTLEPCCHQGRTGPCVQRIVDDGIARVVASMEDPNPLVCGRGFAHLRAHGVQVDVGTGDGVARRMNQPFLAVMQARRPFVVLKAATSLDGRIAAAPGRRTRLTSPTADRHAHAIRAEVDAVGVGSGTVLSDDPLLTARGPFRERPLTRVIFDRRLRTPPTAAVLSTGAAGPVMIVTSPAAAGSEARRRLEAAGAEIEVASAPTFEASLKRVSARGIGSLLLEGGAALHAAAWDAGVVDFVRLYVTPHVLGAEGVAFLGGRGFAPARLIERLVEPLGPDVLVEGYVHRPY